MRRLREHTKRAREAPKEVSSNLRSYIYFKGGSQAKIWERTFQAEREAHGRPTAR